MLLKPTMGVAHGGGSVLRRGRGTTRLCSGGSARVSLSDQKEGVVVKLRVVPPEIFMNKPD